MRPIQHADLINHRYQRLDLLGQGGMGTVYRVADHLTGHIVALKRVLIAPTDLQFASQAASSDPLLALALEFRTLASLRHPHIMGVLDYGFTAFEGAHHQPYFTMPLLDDAHTLTDAATSLDIGGKIRLLVI